MRKIITFLIFQCFIESGVAQTVTIREIYGRTGAPVRNARLVISFPNGSGKAAVTLNTDGEGEVRFDAKGVNSMEVVPMFVVSCAQAPGDPKPRFSIAEIITRGVLTANNCGTLHQEPVAGKLTFFVRRATLWEWLTSDEAGTDE